MHFRRQPTGIDFFDKLLCGGLEADSITTLFGPAGAGKTNLALLAATATAKSGKRVIYIDTEGGFSVERLKQILPDYKKHLDKFIFLRPTSFEEQKNAIESLPKLITNKIGLIVVDTITMLYRLERSFKEDDTANHSLSGQMRLLNELCRTRGIPILLTSQVYSSLQGTSVKIVGGDILTYTSKALLELENANGTRKITLKKHRSLKSGTEARFEIVQDGVTGL
ncbi:DNA repair and recombination protein RadB [Candidatus Woesearchaeota archaeon]|nr:MAG: DNA repair and recombination protein RadB [Candidatus Woesearchaeota archaeon]